MLDHECRLDRAGERTLVEVVVSNETTVDRWVRLTNRLDGRVQPPREDGVPAPGWDDDGYTGVVPAGERLTVGYACAAPPVDPAVEVRDEGRSDGERAETTAADAVRALEDGAPPADAVPADETAPPDPVASMVETLDDPAGATDGGRAEPPSPGGDDEPTPSVRSAGDVPDETGDAAAASGDGPPAAVESWLDAVESRVEDAERLADGDLSAAARVAEARGGADEAAALAETLSADERTLRALAERAARLAERADETDVPAAALRSLS